MTALVTLAEGEKTYLSFLVRLFRLFEDLCIRYVVLHGVEDLPHIASDVDIVVHPEDRYLIGRLLHLMARSGYRLVHTCEYAVDGCRFDFAWTHGDRLLHVGLDVIFHYRIDGIRVIAGETLVGGAVKTDLCFAACPVAECTYLLAKRAAKGSASARQLQRILTLYHQLKAEEKTAVCRGLFGNSSRQLEPYMDSVHLPQSLPIFLKALIHAAPCHRRWIQRIQELLRLGRRWLYPTGAFVVVLGPDGSGKDEVLRGVTSEFHRIFRTVRQYHWRYGVIRKLRRPGKEVHNPHRRAPRWPVVSTLMLVVTLLDYWVGYSIRARQVRCRSGLVLFNRHYEDMQVDPRRYAFGGSMKLLSWLGVTILPTRRTTLLLDAPSHVIHKRKPELTVPELDRLRAEYMVLAKKRNWIVIDTAASLSTTRLSVYESLIEALHRQSLLRRPTWMQSELND